MAKKTKHTSVAGLTAAPAQWTRETLKVLTERALREDVLAPLFRAMDFRDVYVNHGRSEQGKDIVMWKADPIRGRVNVAVVVKAKAINGRSEGQGSAANVATQVRQCFGSPYKNSTSPGEQQVHECLVVCPHELTPDALSTLHSLLEETAHRRPVDYLCGEKLWTLIDEYLGPRTAIEKLTHVERLLTDIDPVFNVDVQLQGGIRTFSLIPKSTVAKEPQFAHFRVKFADTELGEEGRRAFREHETTGKPVTVSGEAFQSIEVPGVFRKLGLDNVASVELGAKEIEPAPMVNIEAGPADTPFLAQNVQLLGVAGSEVVTLESTKSDRAWRIKLRFDRTRHEVAFSLTISNESDLALAQLEAAQFQAALSAAGVLRIERSGTGEALLTQPYEAGQLPPPERGWIPLLEALVAIQRRLSVVIRIPEGAISYSEANDAIALARGLKTGHDRGIADRLSISIDRTGFARLLERLDSDGTLNIAIASSNERQIILGNSIKVGTVVRELRDYRPSSSEIDRLKQMLATAAGEFVPVTLETTADCLVHYIEWLPEAEKAEMIARFNLLNLDTNRLLAQTTGRA